MNHEPQLVIFNDSRDVVLRNDVVQALLRREPEAARAAWQALSNEVPHDDLLKPLTVLQGALEHPGGPAFPDHDALRARRLELREAILPGAQTVFGVTDAVQWVEPLWRECAERAGHLEFRADRTDDHAAPLWLLPGDWHAAAAAVERIESWRRIPAPLGWMAEARYRESGLDAVWPLLAELAWLAPARFDELTKCLADPSIDKLRKRFDESFEGDGKGADLAWFPAWLPIEKPGLASQLGHAQPSRHDEPEQALQLLLALLGLERQGRHHELVERRKALRDLHPWLYGAYMSTR